MVKLCNDMLSYFNNPQPSGYKRVNYHSKL